MDKILLNDLEVNCIIGDLDFERHTEQRLVLDLELGCDLTKVCHSDELTDTVNYVEVVDEVRKTLAEGQFKMIEAAAQAVADVCLAYALVCEVKVTIRKPDAIQGVCAGVQIMRRA